MKSRSMNVVRNGKRYNTEAAQIIASDAYWDGHNFERHGRNCYLYKTKRGNYFQTNLTCWQGEQDTLEPLTREEAIALFEELEEKELDFADAFPGVTVEEA